MFLCIISRMKRPLFLIIAVGLVIGLAAGWFLLRRNSTTAPRSVRVMQFIRNPSSHQDFILPAESQCPGAPFIMPTTGFIGFLWDDSFRPGHRHSGLDIFSGSEPGVTPVVAAYGGYLTRLPDWKSTVIIRIPSDPLQPDRQIWTYYTHMATPEGASLVSDAFPAGTVEVYVAAGTLLGYQGNYSGTPGNPTGVHLHFSIVKDDGDGRFLNETEIANTLDPSPYLGMSLFAATAPDAVPGCQPQP